jgi:hypothetical protein
MIEPGTPGDGRRDTLVMTATFQAPSTPYLVVRDESTRIQKYMCALVSWARTRRVHRIIFGENSNTRFDFSRVVRHLEAAGKEVEVARLRRQGGTTVRQRVRGGRDSGTALHPQPAASPHGHLFTRSQAVSSSGTSTSSATPRRSRHAFRRKYGKPGNPVEGGHHFLQVRSRPVREPVDARLPAG